jgi:hypothetical protein
MKKLPKLPNGTKITFMYRSNEYVNLVSVNKDEVTFYLCDEMSEYPINIIKFPREYLTNLTQDTNPKE